MISRLIRYTKGYVLAFTDTASPERFLNLCKNKGIQTWGLVNEQDGYSFYISRKDYLQLKEILRKTHVHLVIRKKKGLPFFMFHYRKRSAFVIGMLIAAMMLYGMSLFVWDISIEGNLMYTDNIMMNYLREKQIGTGMFLEQVHCDELESEIRRDFEDITWVSVEISGTRLIVHVKENDGEKQVRVENEPSDLIATQQGIVTTMITRQGTPKVKIGDTVNPGDVLVSGEIILHNDAKEPVASRYVAADADITITVNEDYYDDVNRKHQYKIYTGRELCDNRLNVWGRQFEWGIHVTEFEHYDIVTEDSVLHLTQNYCLPIRVGSKKKLEYHVEQGIYSEEEAKMILTDNFDTFLQNLQKKGIQIKGNSVKIDVSEIRATISGTLVLEGPLVQRVRIEQNVN